jgi:hypothetical protein
MKFKNLTALAFSLSITSVVADEFHYNNLLIGGDALGMGGAYTSIAQDLSATHYNPAGLAFATSNTTASINTFAWEQTEFLNVFSNSEDFTRDSFSIIPGFFGGSHNFGKWSIGGSFTVSDYSNERTAKDAVYQGEAPVGASSQLVTEFINIDLENSAYKIAFSLAYMATSQFSVGLSMQAEYRDFKTVQGSGVRFETSYDELVALSGFVGSRRFTDTNIVMQPTIGMLWRDSLFSLGMRLGKEVALSRDYDVTSTIYVTSPVPLPPSVQTASRISLSADEKQKYPYHIAMGGSYQFEKLLLSFDAVYFSKVSVEPVVIEELFTPITRDLKQITNYSLGLSYQLSAKSAIKFGIFTDKSNGIIDTEVDFQRIEDIDLLGLSIAYDTQIFSYPISMGVYHKSGSGNVRTADIRTVENIVGLPLYPMNDNFDIVKGKKRSLVAYISLNF